MFVRGAGVSPWILGQARGRQKRKTGKQELRIYNSPFMVCSSRHLGDSLMEQAPAKKRGRPRKIDKPAFTAIQLEALAIDAAAEKLRPAAEVARALGVTRQAISKMRKDPVYARRVECARALRLAQRLTDRLSRGDDPMKPRRLALQRLISNKATYVRAWVNRHWTGSVMSPLDGQTYETPEALAEHYLAGDGLPSTVVEQMLEAVDKDIQIEVNGNRGFSVDTKCAAAPLVWVVDA